MSQVFEIKGEGLTVHNLALLASEPKTRVQLAQSAREKMLTSRSYIERRLSQYTDRYILVLESLSIHQQLLGTNTLSSFLEQSESFLS